MPLLELHELSAAYGAVDALKGLSLPLHPGAERFYRERGYLR